MKINLAKSAGFCFGVKRALDIALETAQSPSAKKIYMLGDIVHNEDVIKEVKKSGIKKIHRLTKGKKRILLIRAHGAGKATIRHAQKLGYSIVDATCPMVKEIHQIARESEQKGYAIIVIGDKKHQEVQGITGQLQHKAMVIDKFESINLKKLNKIKKACVVVQSTQDVKKATKITQALKPYIKDLRFFNTICNPTRIKQEEIRRMSLENGLMLIIGSKTSANTKRLYEIAKSLNKKSFWVESKKDIDRRWFKGVQKVGVTAGASTPNKTITAVIDSLKKIN